MTKELLDKYFNNKCKPGEVEEVLLWLKDLSNNSTNQSFFKNYWNNMDTDIDTSIDFDAMLHKIHHNINLENTENKKEIKVISLKKAFSVFSKIAATLFIPLLAFSIYYISTSEEEMIYSEISAPNGSRTSFELPDGSTVHLNNGSSLKFPIFFSEDFREVELNGEAYFQIVHNPEKPLIVKTNDLRVKVLGTEFNVESYRNEDNINVTLKNGSIALEREDLNNKIKNLATLKPNQQAVYNKKEKSIKYHNISTNKFIAWKDGKLVYEDDTLEEIFKDLGRRYNVEFDIRNKEVLRYTLTATFTDETITQIMDLLFAATPIDYKIIASKRLNDDSYTKKRIKVSLKK